MMDNTQTTIDRLDDLLNDTLHARTKLKARMGKAMEDENNVGVSIAAEGLAKVIEQEHRILMSMHYLRERRHPYHGAIMGHGQNMVGEHVQADADL